MWVSGGVSGAEADSTILSEAGLFKILPKDERGIADKGYINKIWSFKQPDFRDSSAG